MRVNRSSVLNVMTIWISRELPLFNFGRVDILCAWIGPPSEKLWPFHFLESFRCSISSVWIYYPPESDLRVKSYDHLNFSRASDVEFRASGYIIRLNLISEWKVMTIWISGELPLFNFDHLNFSRSSVVQFRASGYIILLNLISEWKVMTIWISRELPFLNFERLDILCAWIGPLSE